MKLSTPIKEVLVNEIGSALERMRSSKDPNSIMFYFSAVYGILHRIYNIEYDSDLVFAHFVVNSTYQQINARLQATDKVIQIPENLFERLIEKTGDFLEAIKENKNLYEVLKEFTLLGYVTIGNGYYLYQKGLLKI
jgi:hypothetical protein